MEMFWQILIAASVPSAVFSAILGILVRRWEKRAAEREKVAEERENKRHRLELLQTKGILASMSLGEATATALKNGHTNGETEAALKYEKEQKHAINDFLREEGVNSIK